tara:strand:+ start:260 stop:430 length:171 start_codon:yes stop_codon:yes gene_type:complete
MAGIVILIALVVCLMFGWDAATDKQDGRIALYYTIPVAIIGFGLVVCGIVFRWLQL